MKELASGAGDRVHSGPVLRSESSWLDGHRFGWGQHLMVLSCGKRNHFCKVSEGICQPGSARLCKHSCTHSASRVGRLKQVNDGKLYRMQFGLGRSFSLLVCLNMLSLLAMPCAARWSHESAAPYGPRNLVRPVCMNAINIMYLCKSVFV